MSGTKFFKSDFAYATKAILLPATLNCLLSVSCIVMSFSACVCSTLGRPQSCNSCFCSFLSFILPPAAKMARLAFFFHLHFAPDVASAASLTSAVQLTWLSQQEGYACSCGCTPRHCKPETLRRVSGLGLPSLQSLCRVKHSTDSCSTSIIQAGGIALWSLH